MSSRDSRGPGHGWWRSWTKESGERRWAAAGRWRSASRSDDTRCSPWRPSWAVCASLSRTLALLHTGTTETLPTVRKRSVVGVWTWNWSSRTCHRRPEKRMPTDQLLLPVQRVLGLTARFLHLPDGRKRLAPQRLEQRSPSPRLGAVGWLRRLRLSPAPFLRCAGSRAGHPVVGPLYTHDRTLTTVPARADATRSSACVIAAVISRFQDCA